LARPAAELIFGFMPSASLSGTTNEMAVGVDGAAFGEIILNTSRCGPREVVHGRTRTPTRKLTPAASAINRLPMMKTVAGWNDLDYHSACFAEVLLAISKKDPADS
jgi:hypothetical protein